MSEPLVKQTEFEKDMEKEKEFLEKCKPEGIKTELESLVVAYNEQLNALVRNRIDVDMFARQVIINPSKEILDSKVKAENSLANRKLLVGVIRNHIIKFMEK